MIAVGCVLLAFGLLLGGQFLGMGDAAWPVLALLMFGSLGTASVARIVRLRNAPLDERNQTQGVVIALFATFALALLSVVSGFAVNLRGFSAAMWLIGLHAPVIIAALLPLAVNWAVRRHGLWEGETQLSRLRLARLRATGVLVAAACLFGLGLPLSLAARMPQPAPLLPAVRPVPVIVDTDLSHDDILAISMLLRHPSVRVQAVLISGTGEVRCRAGVRNARALLALAGREDIPVACGRETPLGGRHAFPTAWRDRADGLYGLTLPGGHPRSACRSLRSELLLAAVNASPTKPVVLTLGPLTNVAEALQTEPALSNKLTAVFVMGGAVGVAGNIAAAGESIENSTAEWNIWADPRAPPTSSSPRAPTSFSCHSTRHAMCPRRWSSSIPSKPTGKQPSPISITNS